MQRVTVLCVGKLKEKFYLEAAAEYVKRLQRFCKLELVELPESRLPESPSPAEVQRALAAEAAAIRERLPKGGAVIALCIEGKPCSSVELSRRMEELAVAGKTQLTFLIGGSVGLDESLKRQADWLDGGWGFPAHLPDWQLLRAPPQSQGDSGFQIVHVPHDLPPPSGPDHAAGADLSGVSNLRRNKISQMKHFPFKKIRDIIQGHI